MVKIEVYGIYLVCLHHAVAAVVNDPFQFHHIPKVLLNAGILLTLVLLFYIISCGLFTDLKLSEQFLFKILFDSQCENQFNLKQMAGHLMSSLGKNILFLTFLFYFILCVCLCVGVPECSGASAGLPGPS